MYKAKKDKASNSSRILECLYRCAPTARIDIAEQTGIAPATVSQTIAAMIADGTVQELGEAIPEDNTSGRKRVLLDLTPNRLFGLGVEFTEKGLTLCIVDTKGSIAAQERLAYTPELAEHITSNIHTAAHALIVHSGIPQNQLIGVGVAVPGHMDAKACHLISSHPTWADFDAHRLSQALSLPVVCENNVRCMALSEYLFHPQQSPDSFAFFHVGMGMFCASVVEGELFLGTSPAAGEIGHSIVMPGGRLCDCGKRGCLQAYASEKQLLKTARLAYERMPSSLLRQLADSSTQITLDTLLTAYAMGEPTVEHCIAQALHSLSVTISNVAIITSPQKIFLHGSLFSSPAIQAEVIAAVEQQLRFVEKGPKDELQILPCQPIDGAVGGAALAFRSFFL